MFRLPSGENTNIEGGCDDNPVVLQGDTAEQFRSLLWGLYALWVSFHDIKVLFFILSGDV